MKKRSEILKGCLVKLKPGRWSDHIDETRMGIVLERDKVEAKVLFFTGHIETHWTKSLQRI